MHDILDSLDKRGFLYQLTDVEALCERLGCGATTFYVGFDPTADSLHIGHLLPIMAMRRLQQAGHRPIALVGGGTALVGDPSGKQQARPILSMDEIAANAAGLRRQLMQFLDFESDRALLLNNAEWLVGLRYIDFLRDIGRHFSVNRMLAAESVKLRLETGLSFLEFNYTLLQAYDFYVLRRDWNCEVQFGGQDQWGNIVAGVDLTRRLLGETVYGATFPLLLKSDGEKFGKTASGTVWLDPALAVTYLPRRSLTALARQFRGYGRGRAMTARRHPGSLGRRQLAAPTLVIGLGLALLLVPWTAVPLALAAGGYGALLVVGTLLEGGDAVRRFPITLAALAVMHVSWGVGFLTAPTSGVAGPPCSEGPTAG